MNHNGKSLHARLRQARVNLRLTLRDVERITERKITNSHVSQLERGLGQHPTPDTLRTLSKALKLPYLELMILAGYITVRDLKGRI